MTIAGAAPTRHLVHAVKSVWWYVGEVLGEHDYQKYVDHLQAHHPETPVPTEKEFWKARWADQAVNPGSRCC